MPKILYLATNDWFFASHFLPTAKAAQECGLEVKLLPPVVGIIIARALEAQLYLLPCDCVANPARLSGTFSYPRRNSENCEADTSRTTRYRTLPRA